MNKKVKFFSVHSLGIILSLICVAIAILLRMCLGNNLMFFVYHSQTSFFPPRAIYNLIYLLRIIVCSYILALIIEDLNFNKKLSLKWMYCLIALYIEYWLLFFKESVIITIFLISLSVILNLNNLRYSRTLCNFGFNLLISLYSIIQIYLIVCLFSVII